MATRKQDSGSFPEYEKKLERVMTRLGVEKYDYDWVTSRNNNSCYIEMLYHGRVYRFENDTKQSAEHGCNRTCASDLFADVVYTLEGLARSIERGILSLDMLMAGIPSLPAPKEAEECLKVLGFEYKPDVFDEVKRRYRELAKTTHPDLADGDESAEQFQKISDAYEKAKELYQQ